MERFAIKIDERVKLSLYNICRLCGIDNRDQVLIVEEAEETITQDDEPSLCKKIIECVGIQVEATDKMPQKICTLCVDKINDFYEYREMCKATNMQTRELLGLPPEIKDEKPMLDLMPPSAEQQQPPIEEIPKGVKRKRKLKSECINYEEIDDDEIDEKPPKKKIPKNSVALKSRRLGRLLIKREAIKSLPPRVLPNREKLNPVLKEKQTTIVKEKLSTPPPIKEKPLSLKEKLAIIKEKNAAVAKEKPQTRTDKVVPPPVKEKGQLSKEKLLQTKEKPPIKDKTPLAKDKTPVTRDKIPLTRDKMPLTREKTLLSRDKTPLAKDRISLTRDKTPLGKEKSQAQPAKEKIEKEKPKLVKEKTMQLNSKLPILKEKLIKEKSITKDKSISSVPEKNEPASSKMDSELVTLKMPNRRERQRELETKKKRKTHTVQPVEKVKTENLYACIVCPKDFKTQPEYDIHFFREHTPNTLEHGCSPCREAFYDLQEYRDHQLWHRLSSIPFSCFKCNSNFDRITAYTRHFLTSCVPHIEYNIVDDIKCPKCQKTFVTKNLYEWHGCLIKNNSKCPRCSKFFAKRIHLQRHVVLCNEKIQTKPPLVETKKKKTVADESAACATATTSNDSNKIVKIEPDSMVEIENESHVAVPKNNDDDDHDMEDSVADDVGFQDDQEEAEEDTSLPTVIENSNLEKDNPEIITISDDEDESTPNIPPIKLEKVDRRYDEVVCRASTADIPMVQIKQEMFNTEYNNDQVDVSILRNIKPEPAEPAPEPKSPTAIASNVPVPESPTTKVVAAKPTLKLKIKKEHGTLNSSFIESDLGDGEPDSSPNQNRSNDDESGTSHHHKKRNKHKRKIYKIPKQLALIIKQEKESRDDCNEDVPIPDSDGVETRITIPVISEVTSIATELESDNAINQTEFYEEEEEAHGIATPIEPRNEIQMPVIAEVVSLKESEPRIPLISSVTSLSQASGIRVKMEFNNFASPREENSCETTTVADNTIEQDNMVTESYDNLEYETEGNFDDDHIENNDCDEEELSTSIESDIEKKPSLEELMKITAEASTEKIQNSISENSETNRNYTNSVRQMTTISTEYQMDVDASEPVEMKPDLVKVHIKLENLSSEIDIDETFIEPNLQPIEASDTFVDSIEIKTECAEITTMDDPNLQPLEAGDMFVDSNETEVVCSKEIKTECTEITTMEESSFEPVEPGGTSVDSNVTQGVGSEITTMDELNSQPIENSGLSVNSNETQVCSEVTTMEGSNLQPTEAGCPSVDSNPIQSVFSEISTMEGPNLQPTETGDSPVVTNVAQGVCSEITTMKEPNSQSIEACDTSVDTNVTQGVCSEITTMEGANLQPIEASDAAVDPNATQGVCSEITTIDEANLQPIEASDASVDPNGTQGVCSEITTMERANLQPIEASDASVDPNATQGVCSEITTIDEANLQPIEASDASVDPNGTQGVCSEITTMDEDNLQPIEASDPSVASNLMQGVSSEITTMEEPNSQPIDTSDTSIDSNVTQGVCSEITTTEEPNLQPIEASGTSIDSNVTQGVCFEITTMAEPNLHPIEASGTSIDSNVTQGVCSEITTMEEPNFQPIEASGTAIDSNVIQGVCTEITTMEEPSLQQIETSDTSVDSNVTQGVCSEITTMEAANLQPIEASDASVEPNATQGVCSEITTMEEANLQPIEASGTFIDSNVTQGVCSEITTMDEPNLQPIEASGTSVDYNLAQGVCSEITTMEEPNLQPMETSCTSVDSNLTRGVCSEITTMEESHLEVIEASDNTSVDYNVTQCKHTHEMTVLVEANLQPTDAGDLSSEITIMAESDLQPIEDSDTSTNSNVIKILCSEITTEEENQANENNFECSREIENLDISISDLQENNNCGVSNPKDLLKLYVEKHCDNVQQESVISTSVGHELNTNDKDLEIGSNQLSANDNAECGKIHRSELIEECNKLSQETSSHTTEHQSIAQIIVSSSIESTKRHLEVDDDTDESNAKIQKMSEEYLGGDHAIQVKEPLGLASPMVTEVIEPKLRETKKGNELMHEVQNELQLNPVINEENLTIDQYEVTPSSGDVTDIYRPLTKSRILESKIESPNRTDNPNIKTDTIKDENLDLNEKSDTVIVKIDTGRALEYVTDIKDQSDELNENQISIEMRESELVKTENISVNEEDNVHESSSNVILEMSNEMNYNNLEEEDTKTLISGNSTMQIDEEPFEETILESNMDVIENPCLTISGNNGDINMEELSAVVSENLEAQEDLKHTVIETSNQYIEAIEIYNENNVTIQGEHLPSISEDQQQDKILNRQCVIIHSESSANDREICNKFENQNIINTKSEEFCEVQQQEAHDEGLTTEYNVSEVASNSQVEDDTNKIQGKNITNSANVELTVRSTPQRDGVSNTQYDTSITESISLELHVGSSKIYESITNMEINVPRTSISIETEGNTEEEKAKIDKFSANITEIPEGKYPLDERMQITLEEAQPISEINVIHNYPCPISMTENISDVQLQDDRLHLSQPDERNDAPLVELNQPSKPLNEIISRESTVIKFVSRLADAKESSKPELINDLGEMSNVSCVSSIKENISDQPMEADVMDTAANLESDSSIMKEEENLSDTVLESPLDDPNIPVEQVDKSIEQNVTDTIVLTNPNLFVDLDEISEDSCASSMKDIPNAPLKENMMHVPENMETDSSSMKDEETSSSTVSSSDSPLDDSKIRDETFNEINSDSTSSESESDTTESTKNLIDDLDDISDDSCTNSVKDDNTSVALLKESGRHIPQNIESGDSSMKEDNSSTIILDSDSTLSDETTPESSRESTNVTVKNKLAAINEIKNQIEEIDISEESSSSSSIEITSEKSLDYFGQSSSRDFHKIETGEIKDNFHSTAVIMNTIQTISNSLEPTDEMVESMSAVENLIKVAQLDESGADFHQTDCMISNIEIDQENYQSISSDVFLEQTTTTTTTSHENLNDKLDGTAILNVNVLEQNPIHGIINYKTVEHEEDIDSDLDCELIEDQHDEHEPRSNNF